MHTRNRQPSEQSRKVELAGIEAALRRAGERARRRRDAIARRVPESDREKSLMDLRNPGSAKESWAQELAGIEAALIRAGERARRRREETARRIAESDDRRTKPEQSADGT